MKPILIARTMTTVIWAGAAMAGLGCQSKATAQASSQRPSAETPATQPVDVAASRPATQPIDAGPAARLPYTMTRLAREGPVTGVVIKLDLSDPRVHVGLSLTDSRDPDGPGPAVGRLDTILHAAIEQHLEIATNASYFSVVGSRVAQGKKVGYFVGNGVFPSGYLMIDGKLLGEPKRDFLHAALVIHKDGKITIESDLKSLPADTKDAVSGSAKILTRGELTPPAKDEQRHPRTAVGLSADGKTMVILAIDGRRPMITRGTTLAETAAFLKEFGASDGINLDGGGSTTMVVKDAVTGVHAIVNKPSEFYSLVPNVDSVQRPVLDVLGVQIDDE